MTTLFTCVPCRLNHPSRSSVFPAHLGKLTLSDPLGYSWTCSPHSLAYCAHCLVENPHIRIQYPQLKSSPTITSLDITTFALRPPAQHDTDEYGQLRTGQLICSSCRKVSIIARLKQVLEDTAQGGPVRGLDNPWLELAPVELHIRWGLGSCHSQAKKAMEQLWLRQSTRWEDLASSAQQCQIDEAWTRLRYLKTRQLPDEEMLLTKMRLVYELEGVDPDEPGDRKMIRNLDYLEGMRLLAEKAKWDEELEEGWELEDEGEAGDWSEQGFLAKSSESLNDKVSDVSLISWARYEFGPTNGNIVPC